MLLNVFLLLFINTVYPLSNSYFKTIPILPINAMYICNFDIFHKPDIFMIDTIYSISCYAYLFLYNKFIKLILYLLTYDTLLQILTKYDINHQQFGNICTHTRIHVSLCVHMRMLWFM